MSSSESNQSSKYSYHPGHMASVELNPFLFHLSRPLTLVVLHPKHVKTHFNTITSGYFSQVNNTDCDTDIKCFKKKKLFLEKATRTLFSLTLGANKTKKRTRSYTKGSTVVIIVATQLHFWHLSGKVGANENVNIWRTPTSMFDAVGLVICAFYCMIQCMYRSTYFP